MPFRNIFREFGSAEGSESYIDLNVWTSCITIIVAFRVAANGHRVTACFLNVSWCSCGAGCLWLVYVNNLKFGMRVCRTLQYTAEPQTSLPAHKCGKFWQNLCEVQKAGPGEWRSRVGVLLNECFTSSLLYIMVANLVFWGLPTGRKIF